MKILMMADVPPDPDRGAAGTEVQTANALRNLGYDVDTLWAADLGRRIRHGNLHLLLELPRAYERAAVRALRANAYDVVHINQPHGYRAARAIHRMSPSTAVIHRSHGIELHVEEVLARWRRAFGEEDERGRARRTASTALGSLLARHSTATARTMDGHIVSSSIDAEFLARRMGVDRAKIVVVPQAAPDDYLRTPAPPMTDERAGRVLYVGQFAFVKAPIVTAMTFNRLAGLFPELRFTWVCDRAHHAAVREMLWDDVNKVTELRHWTTQEELRDIYDAHGLFLFPSLFEGFGKAFLEAMSRGLCVVASDVGGMHDVIEDGRDGVLVPLGDPNQYTHAVSPIVSNHERMREMSEAAARKAREYTWERVARETAAFYEARIAARRAVRR